MSSTGIPNQSHEIITSLQERQFEPSRHLINSSVVDLIVGAVCASTISAVHASGAGSLETWSASEGALELHEGARDLVTDAGAAAHLTALFASNVSLLVALLVVVPGARTTAEQAAGTACSGCAGRGGHVVMTGSGGGGSLVSAAAEHFEDGKSICLIV